MYDPGCFRCGQVWCDGACNPRDFVQSKRVGEEPVREQRDDRRCKYGHDHATPEGAAACRHAENAWVRDEAVGPQGAVIPRRS